MPAVFNLAAMSQPQAQTLPQASKTAAQQVPPGQARLASGGAASGAAPFGAGAPMATAAVMRPTAHLPIPAPPPVASTSQAGTLAAAAINGLNREPRPRDRAPTRATNAVPNAVTPDRGPVSRGLPGGPAPMPTTPSAPPAYASNRQAIEAV